MQNLADQSAKQRFHSEDGSTGKAREKDFLKSAGTAQGLGTAVFAWEN